MRHRFRPGPAHWDFRCLICGARESEEGFWDIHYPWWAFWHA